MKYIHLNELDQIEICDTTQLVSNVLNGKVAFQIDWSRSDSIYKQISDLIKKHDAKFFIVSFDPFSLKDDCMSKIVSRIEIPKAAIICDLHHGQWPLRRAIQFLLLGDIKTCLIRFNQRYLRLFEEAGISAFTTFYSPDLSKLLKQINIDYIISNERVGNICFVGKSRSAYHKARGLILDQIRAKHIDIDIKTSNGPADMIQVLSNYSSSLNITLNGDFNRRFVESWLSGCRVIVEHLPNSQLIYPFCCFEDYIFDMVNQRQDFNELTFNKLNTNELRSLFSLLREMVEWDQEQLELFLIDILCEKRRDSDEIDAGKLIADCTIMDEIMYANANHLNGIPLDDKVYSIQNRGDIPYGYEFADEFWRCINNDNG